VAAATARLRGLNQIRPPSKTQAFLGRPNFANARGVVRNPLLPDPISYILVLSPRADARRASKYKPTQP